MGMVDLDTTPFTMMLTIVCDQCGSFFEEDLLKASKKKKIFVVSHGRQREWVMCDDCRKKYLEDKDK